MVLEYDEADLGSPGLPESPLIGERAVRGMPISAGQEPGELQLTLKLHWSQVMQEMNRFALSLAMAGKIDAADSWATSYLRSRANSIESGTDEILLSIIAERALKLPRSR